MVPIRRHARDWRTYLACGGLGLVLLIQKLSEGDPQASPNQQQPRKHSCKRPAPARKYKNREHATEDEHRTAEQYVWRWSTGLTGITVIFAGIAAFYAVQTYEQTKRQADIAQKAMISSIRAWIEIAPKVESCTLSWADGGSVHIALTASNKGGSPATRVNLFAIADVNTEGYAFNNEETTKRACKMIEGTGIALFQNSTSPYIQGNIAHLPIGKIEEFRSLNKLTNPNSKIDRFPVPVDVIICASYDVVGDLAPHHTGRIYSIGPRVSGEKETSLVPYFGQDIEPGQMIMFPMPDTDYMD